MKQASTAWIFVSHSNRDLPKVRQVRDALERAGAEPMLFFLKCLSDHDEIDGLIEREINARYFFLLCDSANAKKSKWVQDEVAHVKSLHGRKIELIDLDSDWKVQLAGITNLVSNATAFLSYSHSDHVLVDPVRAALMARDFATPPAVRARAENWPMHMAYSDCIVRMPEIRTIFDLALRSLPTERFLPSAPAEMPGNFFDDPPPEDAKPRAAGRKTPAAPAA